MDTPLPGAQPPPPHILVVDDDVTMRLLMHAALKKAGYTVSMAAGGPQALDCFARAHIDMVMLDVNMPGMNGYEVCQRLRQQADHLLPIVMVTGMDDLDSIEQAYQHGATDFIAKPIHWPLIQHRVRYLLRSHATQLALRTAQAQHAAMLDALPDFLFRADLQGGVREVRCPSEAAVPWLLDSSAVWLKTLFKPAAHTAIRDAMRAGHDTCKTLCIEFTLTDEQQCLHHCEARLVRIDAHEFLGIIRDITQRKQAEHRITRMAYLDSLTGLANRQAFCEHLEREVQLARAQGQQFAVMFMDLDGFKRVNDTLGHHIGDLLLQQAAGRLRQALRLSDLVFLPADAPAQVELARLGGDEFTALLRNIRQPDDVVAIAERVRLMIQQPFVLDNRPYHLSTSTGIALFPHHGTDAAALLQHADAAMYHAKKSGRNRSALYQQDVMG